MSRNSSSIFKLSSVKKAQVAFDFSKAVTILSQSAPQVIGIATTAIGNPATLGNPEQVLTGVIQSFPGITQSALMAALPTLLQQMKTNPGEFFNNPVIQTAISFVNSNPRLAKSILVSLRNIPGCSQYIDWHIKEIVKAGAGISGPYPAIDNMDIGKLLNELPSPPF